MRGRLTGRVLGLLGGAGLVGMAGTIAAVALEAPETDPSTLRGPRPFAVAAVTASPTAPALVAGRPTRVTIDITFAAVRGVADDGLAYVTLRGPGGALRLADARPVRDDGDRELWRATLDLDRNAPPGRWQVDVEAFDIAGARVRVRNAATLTVRSGASV